MQRRLKVRPWLLDRNSWSKSCSTRTWWQRSLPWWCTSYWWPSVQTALRMMILDCRNYSGNSSRWWKNRYHNGNCFLHWYSYQMKCHVSNLSSSNKKVCLTCNNFSNHSRKTVPFQRLNMRNTKSGTQFQRKGIVHSWWISFQTRLDIVCATWTSAIFWK